MAWFVCSFLILQTLDFVLRVVPQIWQFCTLFQSLLQWAQPKLVKPQICIKYSRLITCQSNSSKGRGHDHLSNVTSEKWQIVPRRHYIFYPLRAHSGYLQSNQSQQSNVVSAHLSQITKCCHPPWNQWLAKVTFTLSVTSAWLISGDPWVKLSKLFWHHCIGLATR